MAAVTRVKARPVSPPGYEVNDKGYIATAVIAGDLLIQDSAATAPTGYEMVWVKAPAGAIEAQGIALMDVGAAGGTVGVGIHGEMDGFSGMTRGTPLYPSATVAGGIDTTATTSYSAATTPAVAVPAQPRVRALTASRIRYSFL
jgi:hypothetical protein